MSLVARAINNLAEAFDAFRKHQAEVADGCEFQHPHPSHPCGKRVPAECQGADFSQVAYVLGQGLKDHADRDGLRGVARAVFMDRGGHAVGEVCPTAPPPDRHSYWCQHPDDECNCSQVGLR